MKKIAFSKKEYKELLKTVFIGNYIITEHCKMKDKDPEMAYELADKIFSHAKDFGLEDEIKEVDKVPMPTMNFLNRVTEIIEEYNISEIFRMLPSMLAIRDFKREANQEELNNLNNPESPLPEKLMDLNHKYNQEFEKNGINNFYIKNDVLQK